MNLLERELKLENKHISVAFITDSSFVMQTYVAAMSVKCNKNRETRYSVYVVSPDMTEDEFDVFRKLEDDTFKVKLVRGDMSRFDDLHNDKSSVSYISATKAALLKFDLPNLLPLEDKVLYLDGDIVVRGDLLELFRMNLDGYYVAAAHETGKMYFKSDDVMRFPGYFNSGVMLLNLKKMRQDGITARLIEVKRNLRGKTLMDQPVFNEVFEHHVLHVDSKWNYLALNLRRADRAWTIEQLNALCGANYADKKDLENSAVVIHYSSKEKPWKCHMGWMTDLWYQYYSQSPWKDELLFWQRPKVSVIVPVYNGKEDFAELLETLRNQKLSDIEMIFIDDCGGDGAFALAEKAALEDSRIVLLRNDENRGPGYSRNRGIEAASGQYIAFADSDDFMPLNYYDKLYRKACETGAAVVKGVRYDYLPNGKKVKSVYNQTIVKRLAQGKSPLVSFTYEHTTAIYRVDRVRATNARNGDCFQDEDTIFLMHILHGLKNEDLVVTDDAVYFYRKNSDSVTSKKDANYLRQCSISCKMKIDALLRMPDSNAVREYAAAVFENRIHSRMIMCLHAPITRCDKEIYLRSIIAMIKDFAVERPMTVFGYYAGLILKNDWDESQLYDYIEEKMDEISLDGEISSLSLTPHDVLQRIEYLKTQLDVVQKSIVNVRKELSGIQKNAKKESLGAKLLWQYRLLLIKKMLSSGRRRKRYKEKIQEIKKMMA